LPAIVAHRVAHAAVDGASAAARGPQTNTPGITGRIRESGLVASGLGLGPHRLRCT
jgi:hypothetical protein